MYIAVVSCRQTFVGDNCRREKGFRALRALDMRLLGNTRQGVCIIFERAVEISRFRRESDVMARQ